MNKIELGNNSYYYQVFYKNNKNMYLRVKNKEIIITCNKHVSRNQIESFIKKNEERIILLLNQTRKSIYSEDEMLVFGKRYIPIISYNNRKKMRLLGDNIVINFPKEEYDTRIIEEFYKKIVLDKITELLPELIEYLEDDFSLEEVVFKTQLMKSRYGSCIPQKKIIKLNSILGRFDVKYLKAVLIHEIIHLRVYGHQKDFYMYINKYIPDYKILMNELKHLIKKYEV